MTGSNLNAVASPRPDVTHSENTPSALPPAGPLPRGRNPLRRDLTSRKDSIKDVIQPSLSDQENPAKSVHR